MIILTISQITQLRTFCRNLEALVSYRRTVAALTRESAIDAISTVFGFDDYQSLFMSAREFSKKEAGLGSVIKAHSLKGDIANQVARLFTISRTSSRKAVTQLLERLEPKKTAPLKLVVAAGAPDVVKKIEAVAVSPADMKVNFTAYSLLHTIPLTKVEDVLFGSQVV